MTVAPSSNSCNGDTQLRSDPFMTETRIEKPAGLDTGFDGMFDPAIHELNPSS